MPIFIDQSVWRQRTANMSHFDMGFSGNTPAPYAGIYRCIHCGCEVARDKNELLPRALAHSDKWNCNPGLMRWQLIVQAIDDPSLR